MRASSTRHRLRAWALILGLALGLGAAEVALRLLGEAESEVDVLAGLAARLQPPLYAGDCAPPAPQARLREIVEPSRHADVIYELRPEVDTCFEGARVTLDPRGMRRSTRLETPKPEGTFRVLALGDSNAFGWAIPESATVAAQLEAVLGAFTDAPVEVVNAGVPGYSAYQEAAWLDAYASDLEADCVIVLFVANDMGLPHFLLRPKQPGFSRLWDRVRAATASKRWFTFAPNELATFVSDVDMDRVPERYRHMVGEAGYRDALTRMARTGKEHDFDVVNVFDYSTLGVDSESLVRFQQDLGITALEMPWPMDPAFRVSDTDPHLNRAGNTAVTEFILRRLGHRSVCLPPTRGQLPQIR